LELFHFHSLFPFLSHFTSRILCFHNHTDHSFSLISPVSPSAFFHLKRHNYHHASAALFGVEALPPHNSNRLSFTIFTTTAYPLGLPTTTLWKPADQGTHIDTEVSERDTDMNTDTSTMDQPAFFSSLPRELVAKICSVPSLSKEDLISLRSTSKTQGIHASATKTFAKRYFTDISLLNNKYSLETFVKISQHPVFGPTIRRVQLSCARFNEDYFYDTVDHIRNENYHYEYFSKYIQRLAQRCDDDEWFKVDQIQALLDQAFAHLAQSDQCFVLTVSTDEDQSLGCSKTWVSDMRSKGWWADPQLVLDPLLQAANKSGCKVEKLEIIIDTVSNCGLHYSDPVTDSWKEWNSVRSLSALTFDLKMPRYVSESYTDLGPIQSLLSLAIDLKVLHIRADLWPRDEDKMRTLMESI
jgi:hypothetical protein